MQLNKACANAGIKPIFGYEAYAVDSVTGVKEEKSRKRNHITLLAENNIGYRNILKLASLAYENFYYFPIIDWGILLNNSEGVIVLSGCWSGKLQKLLVEDNMVEAEKWIKMMKASLGDRFYLETQHYDLHLQTFDKLKYLSEKHSIPIVLACDAHYQTEDQANIQEILHAIRDRRVFDSNNLIYGAYQWDADKLYDYVNTKFLGNWNGIFKNVNDIAERCNANLEKGGFPSFKAEGNLTSKEVMMAKCKEGVKRLGLKGAGETYNERFKREISLIEEKGYIDYILIAADLIEWSKDHGVLVGSGRGSSAGSLICYLLGITMLDPIKYGLLFERFIDETRTDPPDIDTDFDATRRDWTKEYAKQKYGEDKVCDIATFARFKGKNSLDEIGKMFKIPKAKIEIVKGYLVERSGADMRAELTILDTFDMAPEAKEVSIDYPDILKAGLLEGQLRHLSVHAAGVLISTRSLTEVLAMYRRKDKEGGERVIGSFEMKDSSELDLIKVDFLGLTELSIQREIYEMAGKNMLEIYDIPLNDTKTLESFKNVDVQGVFQYSGDSTKSVLRQMPYVDFEQLIACLTLSKPGPAHCLHGNTKIYDCDKDEVIPISQAYKRKIKRTLSLYPDGSIKPQEIAEHLRFGGNSKTQKQQVYAIYLSNGRCIRATSEHWFLAKNGWRKLSELSIGDVIICANHDWKSIRMSKILRIEQRDIRTVYDFKMKDVPNYLAEGIVVHNSGSATKYISKMRGKEGVESFDWHPILSDITQGTHGQIIYQEQIIRILREFANFSVTDANKCRILIAKSKGEQEFQKYYPTFEKETKGKITDVQALHLWESIKVFGRYAFNRCLSGDTLIRLANNNQHRAIEQPLSKLYEELEEHPNRWDRKHKSKILTLYGDGRIKPQRIKKIYKNGIKEVYELNLEDRKVKATLEHKFLTSDGWKILKDINVGDLIIADGGYEGTKRVLSKNLKYRGKGLTYDGCGFRKGSENIGYVDGRSSDFKEIKRRKSILTECENCGLFLASDKRPELHHMDGDLKNNIDENVKRVCNSCHKKLEYKRGRKKQWSIGHRLEQRKVISIKYVGKEMTYDIEMDEIPNFIANGVVTHNSHAASYALVGYWSMFLKTHYPDEFYVCKLNHEKEEATKLRMLMDASRKGYTILPPMLGKSDVFWKTEGKRCLRAGLVEVKGVGEKTAGLLVSNNYLTKEDFEKKKVKGVNVRALKALEEINGFYDSEAYVGDYFNIHAYDSLDAIAPTRVPSEQIRDWDKAYHIVTAGRFVEMNYKDIFEERASRGQSADNIRNPEKAKYSMMLLEDETDRALVHIDRYLFDKIGEDIWKAYREKMLVIVEGQKVGGWRMIRAASVTLFSPDEITDLVEYRKDENAMRNKIQELN